LWHVVGFLVTVGLLYLSARLTTEENDPTLARKRGIERDLRKDDPSDRDDE
jgi:hypothetical protein